MSEYIEVGQPLQFTDPNTPSRVGEIVENVSDIYNIPSPRLGMQVFVKSEKKSFVITSLKSKVIGGVDVPEAAVEAFELVGTNSFTWNNDTNPSNMNDFVVAGVYDIKGEHKREDDNLPVLNIGDGHSFNARLTVLDSSISGSGENDDKCITQVLSFSNRLGQGEVYIRTGKGSSLDNLTWEKWSTLQRNVNVDEVKSLDNLIDNGIYSGIYVKNAAEVETFVMVVINNYALANKKNMPKSISQYKYSVSLGGSFAKYETRVGTGVNDWGDWEILNKDEINSMITKASSELTNYINSTVADAKRDILEGIDPNKIDSLKDIVDWIDAHGGDVTAIYKAIQENTKAIMDESERATTAEQNLYQEISIIEDTAARYDGNAFSSTADEVTLTTTGVNINKQYKVVLPAATTEKAGVMSAEDKVALNNCKIIDIENEDLAVEEGFYSGRNRNNASFYIIVQVSPLANRTHNITQYKFIGGNVLTRYATTSPTTEITWSDWMFVNKEKVDELINQSAEYVQNTLLAEIEKIKDGDTIVGQAREIHSRNGKNVPDSFLARTTAGSGTIGDGVASLKSVGGNIVKNLVDGTFESGWEARNDNVNYTVNNRLVTFVSRNTDGRGRFKYGASAGTSNHIYYQKAFIRCSIAPNDKEVKLGVMNNSGAEYTATYAESTTEWQFLSIRYRTPASSNYGEVNVYDTRKENQGEINIYKYLYVDLTARFGAGNEPDKATCDKLFSTMDALPKGLTIAKPTEFKSTGFNQFNPDNVLEGKTIANNTIGSGDKKIAIIPCLPCKVGAGENNGYCIHGDFGDDIKVYLTPLNPMEVEGELYMHELTKDATTDTYVPLINGYMLVEVPTTANLCAHFLWSEDKCERDTYEPYFESKVELPTIPQMSEWGLAGMYINNELVQDVIDFDNNRYIKRIGKNAEGFFPLEVQEEYPLPAVDNNYISSDYGVEQFDSVVPCNANNLYYMRSLAGETRNFLDRMYANTKKENANEVADYITNYFGSIPVIQQTEATVEIAPNVLNLWNEVTNLDITLAEADATKVNEYMFQFTSGATATTLVLPADIKWVSAPNIHANKTYQVSIINNLGVIGEFSHE